MKNKLLLTSALAGSLVFQGLAYGQTTVSGNLDLSLKSISTSGTKTHNSSGTYVGKESQINVANKGKLNVGGIDYAAGFSFELDGNEGAAAGTTLQNSFNENVYIDFISGNTTLTFGVDHIQNSDRTLGTLIGLAAKDLAHGVAGSTGAISDTSVGSDPAGTYGAGLVQKFSVGSLSGWFSPKARGANAGVQSDTNASVDNVDNGKSAYELGFVGDLGVKGLSTHLFYNKATQLKNETQAVKATNIGASYNFGQLTFGANRKDVDETTAGTETETTEYSIAYAATKDLSIGVNISSAEQNGRAEKEKVKSVAVGYNLGPVAVVAQYADVDGKAGATGAAAEAELFWVRLSTKF